MLTIRQLAKASGYSPTTISLVLNNSPAGHGIPQSTRKKIRAIARQLGYHPNQFARSLRSSRSQTVAVIVPDISDPYCGQILHGVNDALYRSARLPLLIDIQNSRARYREYVTALFERRIEGVIAVANSLQLQADMLGSFEQNQIPVIVIGQAPASSWISSVCVDNRYGAFCAIEHLYNLGHRRIAFIKGPSKVIDSVHRWNGIIDFARQASLHLDQNIIVQLDDNASSSEAGFKATNKLLQKGRAFTAVVAFDDMTAFGAIRALTQKGRRVPEDCSVIGFDDLVAGAYYNPPLTTVSQSMEELGRLGITMLLDRLAAKKDTNGAHGITAHSELKPMLVVRASTAAV
jgi:DNA-binding LacI/PurR family transcriptional regulator